MRKYHPLVSIVIPVYNGSNYLSEAINSALAQTYDNIEVIVVNDGSTDGGLTDAVARSYGNKIRYFLKENGGSSSALNEGIRQMRGEWFSWLSHDDLYYPEKIEKQIEYICETCLMRDDLKKQIMFAGAEQIDKNGKIIRTSSEKQLRLLAKRVNSVSNNKDLIAEPTGFCFHGCSCLIHRSAFDDIGFFDESLRLVNDVDMWFRLYSNEYQLNYIPEILVKGRVHQNQISRSIGFSYHNPEQDMYWQRSLLWIIENCKNDFDVFFKYGKNAVLKTRYIEGKQAFNIARQIDPRKTIYIFSTNLYLHIVAQARSYLKQLYLLLKL